MKTTVICFYFKRYGLGVYIFLILQVFEVELKLEIRLLRKCSVIFKKYRYFNTVN